MLAAGKGRFPSQATPPIVIGESPAWSRVLEVTRRIASRNSKVLITGESGAGKDVVARYLHAHSPRARHAFVALNCASISESLLESELFGHVRGSFTGAFRDRAGKLEAADRGTIFLDEVGEMSLRMQALLLRFLETGEIQSVGSDAPSTVVDVRVVAATNRDLAAMVAQRGFREDLLFRINVTHIEVPPLRDRREDIRHFVRYFVEESGRDYQITEAALRTLEAYHWPGNVRELYNVIEQALSLASADRIDLADLPARIATAHGATRTVRRERRRSVADGLYEQLVSGACRFWDDIHPLFLSRDLTRADLRQLIGLGLQASGGNYRMLLDQFGMDQSDYKRLLNFLAAHDCSVDCKVYRVRRAAPLLTSRLPSGTGGAVAAQPPVIV